MSLVSISTELEAGPGPKVTRGREMNDNNLLLIFMDTPMYFTNYMTVYNYSIINIMCSTRISLVLIHM